MKILVANRGEIAIRIIRAIQEQATRRSPFMKLQMRCRGIFASPMRRFCSVMVPGATI